MSKSRQFIILLVLLLVLIVPSHVIQVERAVTVDEPWWLISGSNYYYALTHKDFANTIYDYHPAVTTTWVVTAGMLTYFPEYRGGGQGYFDVRKPHFEEFLRENGKESVELMRISRLIQAGLLITLAILCFYLLQLILDQLSAFLAITIAFNAPFFLGHSRLLNHEGMLTMFMLASLLGMQVYLGKDRKSIYLLISGITFGLAQLTKSSSIVLIGVIGLMLLVDIFNKDDQTHGLKLLDAVKIFAVWFGSAALTYFILWPGMWVAPREMLSGVYGNAFSYAFQGARLDVTEELEPASFNIVTRSDAFIQYIRYWLSSTTPLTWIGLMLSLIWLFEWNKNKVFSMLKMLVVYLALLGGLVITLFAVAQGRNAARYIIIAYVSFDVIAGIGWGYALTRLQSRWKLFSRKLAPLVAVVLLALLQIGFGLPYAPYYFTYKAPFASEAATYGYGEGMAEAADYLAAKPNAKDIRAYVYSGMGTFSYFFPGETQVLKRVYLIDNSFDEIEQGMKSSDYLVLYPIVRDKQPETEKILKPLETITPEKIIYINGLEYIRIYKISEIPESVYAKLGY